MSESEQNSLISVLCSREWPRIWWCGSSVGGISKNITILPRGEETELSIPFI